MDERPQQDPQADEDELDTEGQGRKWLGGVTPSDGNTEPEDAHRPDEPGPDDARLSDRNRKVGIVPVTWD